MGFLVIDFIIDVEHSERYIICDAHPLKAKE